MVFLTAETDPYLVNQGSMLDEMAGPQQVSVRRPVRGVEVHEPTYSYMRVIGADGERMLFEDSSSLGTEPVSRSNSNYLLQALSFSTAEKVQIVPSFGETYAFFFGDQPVQAQISGGLLHTPDFPWSEEMWENYRSLMRGTKLAELGARLYLYYDGVLLEGYPIAYNPNQTADVPNFVPFGMTILVTGLEMLRPKSVMYPSRRQDVDLSSPEAYEQLAAMSNLEQREYAEKFRGSQITQLNQASYNKERHWYKANQALGILLEAYAYGRLPPLALQKIETVDSFMRHGGGAIFEMTPSDWAQRRIKPLRGRISDNLDEYLVRAQFAPGVGFEGQQMTFAPAWSPSLLTYEGDEAFPDTPDTTTEDAGSLFEATPGDAPDHGSTVTGGSMVPDVV